VNSRYRSWLFWPFLILVVILMVQLVNQSRQPQDEWEYSEFLNKVEQGAVKRVEIKNNKVVGTLKTEKEFFTFIPAEDPDLIKTLREQNITIKVKDTSEGLFFSVLLNWFPILLFIGIWFFMMRQMQAGGSRAMNFGKSKAKLQSDDQVKVTFEDVAGVEEAKEELSEIVEFLRDPQRFQKLGGRIPKGVMLSGPPGTGKTLLARAIAGEADVPFFSISGSDFVEMFVGVGASRVRDLFEKGKKNAPCIIFIDELDAVGRHRGAGLGGGHDEREQTLNALLVEMDGFEVNSGVILIAATNRPDVLDPALLRPGRFDRQVIVDYPDLRGREGILRVHMKQIRVDDNVDIEVLARGTPGFSGADLANMVNEAALLAARQSGEVVGMRHFDEAKEKVMMGPERRSRVISEAEKRSTAYHEAGHAIVAAYMPHSDPLHKITIIPRGRALGLTHFLPREDKYTQSRGFFMDEIAKLLGGRVAEEIIYGEDEISTGAGNDIDRATKLARKMVCDWGMSDDLGPVAFGKRDEQIFLGREFAQQKDYSEDTAIKIDSAIRKIVLTSYVRAREVLNEHLDKLHVLAEALLEYETLDASQVAEILDGNTPKPSTGATISQTPDLFDPPEE
jgi:cell division protease FtsH